MAHRKHSLRTPHNDEYRPHRAASPSRNIDLETPHESRYSRYTDPEDVQPRRRRWAAGYIDRAACPSYAYISTRSRSPDPGQNSDIEYITRSRSHEEDYIEAREPRNTYISRHTTNQHSARQSRYHDQASDTESEDEIRHSDLREPSYGSDVEDQVYSHPHKQTTADKSHDSDTGEGSDIVIINRRDVESDTASTRSRQRSHSRSDRQSARSPSKSHASQGATKTDSDSSSDSEGGYISLEEYIASRSDCVSNRSSSESGGEGSDLVTSDGEGESRVGEGSDGAHGSDVASVSDGGSYYDDEDCIEDGDYYHA